MKHRRVANVMTINVVTVSPDTPYKEIADALAFMEVSALPVVAADGRVVGVVSEADLMHKIEYQDTGTEPLPLFERKAHREARAKAAGTSAADVMTTPAVTIGSEETIVAAARLMDAHKVKRLPVVNDKGHLIGIVSRRDLLRVFLRSDMVLKAEVETEVLRRVLWLDDRDVAVDVVDGVVTLDGEVEQKSLAEIAVRLARTVDGVVDVIDRIAYARDGDRVPQ